MTLQATLVVRSGRRHRVCPLVNSVGPDEDGAVAVRPLRTLRVGDGRTLLLLHGFAMQPRTYLPLARLLADRIQVVIPAIFELPERWTFGHALDCLEATLDDLGISEFAMLGHSFGGGLELGLAVRRPGQVLECVFGDTLGVRERFGLAAEALRNPPGILALATLPATEAFVQSLVTHPLQLGEAALWGFASDRSDDIAQVVDAGIPCHVMWANRDTLLARSDGQEFARRLHATFTVASDPVVDHDWMFDDPELFAAHLEKLRLRVFA
jgi:pimeloyl-ACP methyl ester carboxylesterase